MSVHSLARSLGVSAATVSLALRDHPRISLETRRRVAAAARAVGFVPNARLGQLMREVRASAVPGYRGQLAAVALYPERAPWERLGYLQEFIAGAERRAQDYGYRLERFALGQPAIRLSRLRDILKARGIQGLFLLGCEQEGQLLPEELSEFPLVTQGASIVGLVNRVMSNFCGDACALLEQLADRGYLRPGLMIESHGDRRTDFGYSNTYLGMFGRLFPGGALPVLRSDRFVEAEVSAWLAQCQPDVLIIHHQPDYVRQTLQCAGRLGLRVPRDLGVVLLSNFIEPHYFAGMRQIPKLMGEVAIENLIDEIMLHGARRVRRSRLELVGGEWNEGASVRSRQTTASRVPLMV